MLIPVARASDLERDAKKKFEAQQAAPVVQALSQHVHKRWVLAKRAKIEVETRLIDRLRQRRGEYTEQKLAQIKAQGGSEIFMNITAVKCRAASAWLRDTMLGTGADRPWQLEATPVPDLPDDVIQGLRDTVTKELGGVYQMGAEIPEDELRAYVQSLKDEAMGKMQDEAKLRVERMELKMEDQLVEGGFSTALSQFIDDLTTFSTAILKGPVIRKRMTLQWDAGRLVPVEKLRLEWERVDPFMIYPASWASEINDGPLIERHKLTREDLEALIGVDGYSEEAIRQVLLEFETGGLREWLTIDSTKAKAEGKLRDAYEMY